jgi:hypothetical protein
LQLTNWIIGVGFLVWKSFGVLFGWEFECVFFGWEIFNVFLVREFASLKFIGWRILSVFLVGEFASLKFIGILFRLKIFLVFRI